MTRNRLVGALIAVALVALACGGAGDEGSATTAAPTTVSPATTAPPADAAAPTTVPTLISADEAGFPVTVTDANGEVTVPSRPQRIAALSSVFVESLFAIGAGDQVIAGDLFSNYPPETGSLQKIDSFNLNLEAIVELEPDLVLLSFDPGEVVAGLQALEIPTILLGTPLDVGQAYAQILLLGRASGHSGSAEELVEAMRLEIKAVVNEVDGRARGLTYYHESDPFTFYTPNSSSFIGKLYGNLGMVNIADAAPDDFGGGFPQLSPEFIIEADPLLIFSATAGENTETFAARPGWETMSAVRSGQIYSLDPDIASRWGPRIVEFMRSIADAVQSYLETT